MKLKEFDFKLPSEDKRKKKIMLTGVSMIVIILIITIASTFAYYQSITLQNPVNSEVGSFSNGDIIFAVTIGGTPSQTFPTKGSGYVANTVTCDKGATGVWNNDLWNVKVGNLTQSKTTCNINFISEANTLNYKILSQFGGKDTIVEAPISTFASASASNEKKMYKMEDDYGISYYYRGAQNLLNNNLIFAGFQWKIVRINGDSTIRIIYNGTEEQFNQSGSVNTIGVNTQIGTATFNVDRHDNKYVGYMYGGSAGSASTSRAQAATNQTNSNAKSQLDVWYINNILSQEASVTSKLTDRIFCNDRRLQSEVGGSSTGLGYGTSVTSYAVYYRLVTNKTPTLKCGNKNDMFSVSESAKGNGALTYPIGLITADEASLAGGVRGVLNSSYYLFTNQDFWTFSPSDLNSYFADIFNISATNGHLNYNGVDNLFGLRPYITLESNHQVTGDGSASNPFKVI